MANQRSSWRIIARQWWEHFRLPLLVGASFALPPLLFLQKGYGSLEPGTPEVLLVLSCLALGYLTWGAGWVILRSATKSALFAVAMSVLLLRYGDWFPLLKGWLDSLGNPYSLAYFLIIIATPLLLYGLHRLRPKSATRIANFLLAFSLLMLGYVSIQLGVAAQRTASVGAAVATDEVRTATATTQGAKPDIYYLVFDRHVGGIGLREGFGGDPAALQAGLRQRGFYVADQSFANYPTTMPSLASSLNGSFLEFTGPVDEVDADSPLYGLFARPAVAEFLKNQGYTYDVVGSWATATGQSEYADTNPRFGWNVKGPGVDFNLDYVSGVFATSTALGDAYDRRGKADFSPYGISHGNMFQDQMTEVGRITDQQASPKFVFLHALMPHHPFIFNADGGTDVPPTLTQDERYLEQLKYVDTEILKLVDRIKASRPENPPVIILAADEGEYPNPEHPNATEITSDAATSTLRRKLSILSAFYFPDQRYDALTEDLTPVNSFRITLNKFFGTELPRLEDRVHTYSPSGLSLDFTDITDRIRRPASN